MRYDRTYTTLGEKIATAIGCFLLGTTLLLATVVVAYQITA